jgi:hypothetical protein
MNSFVQSTVMDNGSDYAARLRRKAPSPTDVWLLDEVVVTIGRRKHGSGVPWTTTVIYRRNCAGSPQYQSGEAGSGPVDEDAGMPAQAHSH